MPYRNRETYRVVVRDSNNRLLVMNLESKWLDAITCQTVPNPKFSSMSLNMMTDQEIMEYVDWEVNNGYT